MTRVQELWATTGDGVRLPMRYHSRPGAPAVLLLHGFAQNSFSLDAPGRSLARHLWKHGFQVMVGELRGRHARWEQLGGMAHDFASHVEQDAPALLGEMERVCGSVPLLMVGHSMGGLITVGLAPEHAGKLSMRAALCPPWDFLPWLGLARAPLAAWLRAVHKGLPLPFPTRGLGYGLAAAFPALNGALDLPLSVWAPGSVEPALLRAVLQKGFSWESARVAADLLELGATQGRAAGAVPLAERLGQLEGPLLIMAGTADGLASPRSVKPMVAHAGRAQVSYVECPGVGHLDALIGRRAARGTWATLVNFLKGV